jgi:hypothetical protein
MYCDESIFGARANRRILTGGLFHRSGAWYDASRSAYLRTLERNGNLARAYIETLREIANGHLIFERDSLLKPFWRVSDCGRSHGRLTSCCYVNEIR